MQLESAEDLVLALQNSGLFTTEQFGEIVRELGPLGRDPNIVMKRLVKGDRITIYQLKKVLHGRTADLLIGPFVVTDKLGEGGMGKVFRAQRAGEKETVALKVVRAALVANPIVRGRYAREVQTTSTLAHPNIVRLFDAGESNGRFYLAMEFVDGIDLARMMHDFGILEVTEACEYARQVALGLQHAHEKGFVHRDIKPSNIVVAGERHLPQATEPAIVKILDLGLARAIDPDDMVAPNLTRDHTVVGTPDYMAPEQAKNSKRVDPRSDLYSLGCAMYFLLTGQVPFPKRGPIEKIIAHQIEMPAPIQAMRPEVPAGLAQLITQLMAKEPDDRVQTAGELATALEPYSRYAHDAPPVILVRDRSAKDQSGSASTVVGQGTIPPSLGSSPSPLSHFGLSEEEDSPKPQLVTPSDRTPRPQRPTSDESQSAAPRKAKASTIRPRKRRVSRRSQFAAVPHFVWIALALLGFAILVFMLGFVASR